MPTDNKDYLKEKDAIEQKILKDAAEAVGLKHPPEEKSKPNLKVVK